MADRSRLDSYYSNGDLGMVRVGDIDTEVRGEFDVRQV